MDSFHFCIALRTQSDDRHQLAIAYPNPKPHAGYLISICGRSNQIRRRWDVDVQNKSIGKCPLCNHSQVVDGFAIANAPVTVASVFSAAEEARTVPTGQIQLACCTRCGFVFNRAFDPDLAKLGAKYESSQRTSPHFSAFARELAKEWVDRYGLRGGHVIEVGCGDGAFLAELLQAGVTSVTGIDPLAQSNLVPTEHSAQAQFRKHNFTADDARLPANALVCRHTLEHIPNVAEFMKLLRLWSEHNPDSPILIEVPAADRIFAEGAFWDIYYEHCNYFTLASLRHAFESAGLCVKHLKLAYDGQYILLDSEGRVPAIAWGSALAEDTLYTFSRFSASSHEVVERCRSRLLSLAGEGGPVVLWQGAAKTVGFMTAIGGDIPLAGAVDLNPMRQSQYLPPSGLRVLIPDELVNIGPRHIVLMNPVYKSEVQVKLDAMGVETSLHTIDQLLS